MDIESLTKEKRIKMILSILKDHHQRIMEKADDNWWENFIRFKKNRYEEIQRIEDSADLDAVKFIETGKKGHYDLWADKMWIWNRAWMEELPDKNDSQNLFSLTPLK